MNLLEISTNLKIFEIKFPIDDVSNWDCFTKKFFVLDLQRSLKKYDRSNNYIGGRDIKLKGKKQSKFLKKENWLTFLTLISFCKFCNNNQYVNQFFCFRFLSSYGIDQLYHIGYLRVFFVYHLMQPINNEMKILVGVLFLQRKMQSLFYFISEAALSLAILTLVMSDAAFKLIRSSWAFWFSSSPPKKSHLFNRGSTLEFNQHGEDMKRKKLFQVGFKPKILD